MQFSTFASPIVDSPIFEEITVPVGPITNWQAILPSKFGGVRYGKLPSYAATGFK